MNSSIRHGLALGALLVAAACTHNTTSDSTTTTGSRLAGRPIDRNAIDSIASARCDRDQGCNNIGAQKKYSNREACMSDIRSKGLNDLTADSCPSGVDGAQLQKCLADIKGERCDNPLDTISRLNACRTDSLCPR